MQPLPPAERDRLRVYLVETGLSGDTRTTRANAVGNAEKLAAGDPDKALGLGAGGLSDREVMAAVASLCGCSADLSIREGAGVIDPDRTLAELEALAVRLCEAAERRESLLVCTGHPTGLLPLYQRVARALEEAGSTIMTPAENVKLGNDPRGGRTNKVRYLDGVGAATDGANLYHTHDSWLMHRLLDECASPPDLVLADHGFAGAAIARGVETVSFTDVNDPALAVAWAQGRTRVVVPLDDNRPPRIYAPLGDVLERSIGLGTGRAPRDAIRRGAV